MGIFCQREIDRIYLPTLPSMPFKQKKSSFFSPLSFSLHLQTSPTPPLLVNLDFTGVEERSELRETLTLDTLLQAYEK